MASLGSRRPLNEALRVPAVVKLFQPNKGWLSVVFQSMLSA